MSLHLALPGLFKPYHFSHLKSTVSSDKHTSSLCRLILMIVLVLFNDRDLRSVSVFYSYLLLCQQKYHQLASFRVTVKEPENEDAQLSENLVYKNYIQHYFMRNPLFI